MVPSPLQVVALNKRSKEAESAFLGIYKQLIEAPGESPTKIRDVHLHQQQQFNQHAHVFRFLDRPPPLHYRTRTFPDESLEIGSRPTLIQIPEAASGAYTRHMHDVQKHKCPVPARSGDDAAAHRCAMHRTFSASQSLSSQTGFQNSAWGHFRSQHGSLSAG